MRKTQQQDQGDTIISAVRTCLKAIGCVGEGSDHLIASTGFTVLTPGMSVEPERPGYVIQSRVPAAWRDDETDSTKEDADGKEG